MKKIIANQLMAMDSPIW